MKTLIFVALLAVSQLANAAKLHCGNETVVVGDTVDILLMACPNFTSAQRIYDTNGVWRGFEWTYARHVVTTNFSGAVTSIERRKK